MRLQTVVRVRPRSHVSLADVQSEQPGIEAIAKHTDISVVPRGFQFGWQLVDIWLADTAEPDALSFVGDKVGKGFGVSWHPVIATPDAVTLASPMWGAAMWPKTEFIIQRLTGQKTGGDEPFPVLGGIIGVVLFWPMLAVLILMLCGTPLIGVAILYSMEKDRTHPQLTG
ncbi:MAG: hypothetical protein GY913_25580 [Proteobacteria bacterium]|nr:hypothetical protein [Pseudomonadota bacterium]MCP4920286.1 hypothetical protein [Pseudomonadota bacterium]